MAGTERRAGGIIHARRYGPISPATHDPVPNGISRSPVEPAGRLYVPGHRRRQLADFPQPDTLGRSSAAGRAADKREKDRWTS
jgi:hypothetical protein